ncbi:MAG: hypothetical protein VX899_16985 [Myxococcota bacterium]|nr:hypothetical protein [Myxococcota bacterium]
MDAVEDTLARTRFRGPVLLGLGVGLCTVGVLSACGGPTVIPYRPPTTPIVALEPLDDGELVVAAGVTNTVIVDSDDGESFVMLVPGTSYDLFSPAGAYAGTAALGVQRFELRGAFERNAQDWMFEAGLGLRLPSFARWTPVVDVATGYEEIRDEYTQQADTAEGLEEEDIDYAYRVVAPSARVRMVWQPSDALSVPLSLRVSHSRTVALEGLEDRKMPTQTYVDLGAGVVYKPGRGCLRLGAGVAVDPRSPTSAQLHAALGCNTQLWGGAQ